ncbi:MAG: hypothetical protein Q8873_04810 [Bacillota bacterium]|nr:hypothetical protein [Bacillota bacterium]
MKDLPCRNTKDKGGRYFYMDIINLVVILIVTYGIIVEIKR